METTRSHLLIDGPLVTVPVKLTRALGSLSKAAVLQQVSWKLQAAGEDYDDGYRWVPLLSADLADLTGLSESTVRRLVVDLEKLGVLVSEQPETFNRRKWYRIDHAAVDALVDPESVGTGQPTDLRASRTRAAEGPESGPSQPRNLRGSSSTDLETTPPEELPLLDDRDVPRDTTRAETIAGRSRAGRALRQTGRARKPDPVWDALVEVFPVATSSENSFVGKIVRELKAMDPVPEPAEIVRRATWVRETFDNASVAAVTKHWTRAGQELARRPRRLDLSKVQ